MVSPSVPPIDPQALESVMRKVGEETRKLLYQFNADHSASDVKRIDPLGLFATYEAFVGQLLNDPQRLLEAQFNAWKAYCELWQSTWEHMLGHESSAAPLQPQRGDRRFKDAQWGENPFFDFIKHSYLLISNLLTQQVADLDGLDEHEAQKVRFYTQRYIDAMAPTNFVMTNPEVLRATVESHGQNLIEGWKNFLADIDLDSGSLRISMVDKGAFEVGRNVATAPGSVVFENELMQLIQYSPTTESVYARPLVITPPWINKYYILDLQESNSFIRWAVAEGFTVFVISWVNPDATLRTKDFEDYVFQGPLAALDAVQKATGSSEVNMIGYCIGGTLLAATLAYLHANGDQRVVSATFFTTLTDFTEPGDLGIFIDEHQVSAIEMQMEERGYLDGAEMAAAFNLIRANDLIWSFFVNNYLLGKEPAAFDLLYWNSDSTRMPARMHSTYLRRLYIENALQEPGGISIGETPIDLSIVDLPLCFVSALEDHIAPWKSTYIGAQGFGADAKFILSKAGHVAGIINPPSGRQYGYFTGPGIKALAPEEWFARTTGHDESWWPEWSAWLSQRAGEKVPAREPGDGELAVIEAAPGRYVRG